MMNEEQREELEERKKAIMALDHAIERVSESSHLVLRRGHVYDCDLDSTDYIISTEEEGMRGFKECVIDFLRTRRDEMKCSMAMCYMTNAKCTNYDITAQKLRLADYILNGGVTNEQNT